jgi:SAM-dependent methyltransferase
VSHGSAFSDRDGRLIDFGRTASDYEQHRPGFPDSFFDRLHHDRWIRPGQRALDLATGTGAVALGLASRGLEVVGLDLAPELLAVARNSAARQGLPAHFVQARAETTGFDDGTFDLVTAGQCWWWFDAGEVISEVRRILSPGGRLIICNFSYLALPGNVAARTEELVLHHNPGWPKAGWRGVHPEQIKALDHGGFRQVESFSYVTDVTFDHAGWRGRIRTCNGVGSELEPERVERFDHDLAGLLAAEFPGELAVPHRVFAASGIRA